MLVLLRWAHARASNRGTGKEYGSHAFSFNQIIFVESPKMCSILMHIERKVYAGLVLLLITLTSCGFIKQKKPKPLWGSYVECRACDATGVDGGTTCSSCNGLGWVKFKAATFPTLTSTTSEPEPESEPRRESQRESQSDFPELRPTQEFVRCTDCHGTGGCCYCHGQGWDYVRNASGDILTSQDCNICHGSGRCQVCYGSGGHYETVLR